ncbi:MAG TPA: MFS transporter [Solirubrobacteraceae bacterium]|nr:MFS transporter [Solirubrobacteraceae bacterium]
MQGKWWTLIVVCVATFMLLLDITIVNVALPTIAHDLKGSFSDIQWVIDAYTLTLAALLLTAGTLADLFGRKLIFVLGVGLFAAASLLCGLSPSALFLILARGFQGVGGAMMYATALALLAQEFHGRERGTAFGIWGAAIAASAAVGPLLGGALTDAFGWSSIFFINVPVGVAVVVLSLMRVRESKDPQGRRIDWIGTTTFTAALFLLVLALIEGNSHGWTSPLILALLAAGGGLLVVFVIAELVQRDAMFDMTLFRKPSFTGASITAFAIAAGLFAMFLYLVLYLQTILGYSPLQTGLRFLPFTVVSFVAAAVTGRVSYRFPARALLFVGLLLTGIGLLLWRELTPTSSWTVLLPGFLVGGVGIGMINPVLASVAIGVVPPERSGMAAGINNTFRQVGTAAGIAALGAIFESALTRHLSSQLRGTPGAAHAGQISRAVAAGGAHRVLHAVPAAARGRASQAIHVAYTAALSDILLVGGIVALVAAVLALILVRRRDFVTYSPQEPTAQEPAAVAVSG